jgi:hypothetical protein
MRHMSRHYDAVMARWEPGARERLVVAAVDLFNEQGYDNTPPRSPTNGVRSPGARRPLSSYELIVVANARVRFRPSNGRLERRQMARAVAGDDPRWPALGFDRGAVPAGRRSDGSLSKGSDRRYGELRNVVPNVGPEWREGAARGIFVESAEVGDQFGHERLPIICVQTRQWWES